MIALFKLNRKKNKNITEAQNDSVHQQDSVHQHTSQAPLIEKYDEEALKKSIAVKLATYRPIEREANFKGPKYF